jgi:hypothetical protein
MKKLLIILIIFSKALMGQSIKGKVTDSASEPLVGAAVSLYTDTLLIQGKFTDAEGKFEFNDLRANLPYFLKVTYIGLTPYESTKISPPADIGVIALMLAEETTLKEVLVKGKKPLIENELDRTIVNVEALPGGNTGNVYSLLENTPGVSVVNSSVSLNGKQNVSILINGRLTQLGGKDLENFLKSLSASDIEKIELMDNPPAKYDAAGGAIINLKLKASRQVGWSGSLNLTHNRGKYLRNYDGGYFNEHYWDFESRQTKFLKENQLVPQRIENSSSSKGLSYHGGVDYFLSDKTTMGVFYRNSSPNAPSKRIIESIDSVNNLLITTNLNKESKMYDGAAVYITQKFGRKELSLEVNQVRYLSDARQNFKNVHQDEFQYLLDTKIRTRSASLDYIHPIKKGNFEAGLKTTFMNNNNVNTYQDLMDSRFTTDWSKSNHFQYHENINAIYAGGQREYKRWSLKAGLRVENTRAEGRQLGNVVVPRSGFERSYTNVFHNLILNYKLDSAGTNTITFVTQRRLNRPCYLYLNPFMQYRDEYNYSTGNPELNPQIQNRYELTFRSRGKWTVGVNINPFKDVILPTTETINNVFYTKHDNIAEGYMYILALGLTTQITSWWGINYGARLSHIGLKGKLYVENLDYSINLLQGELNNNFKISDKMSLLNYVNYVSKDYNGQTVTKGRILVNLGWQYKFLKDKASLNVSFDDIFHSWRSRNFSTNITNAYITSLTYSDTRRVGISLNYRFGNNKEMKKGKSNNASDERI